MPYDPYNPPLRAPRRSPMTVAGLSPEMMARNPGYANLAARNANPQPYSPYTGSPSENPTGAGIYANSVRDNGLMTNSQAGGSYGRTGYMPGRTVGGLYGPPQGALPFERPKATAGAINALAVQNPDGRWYQGATPGMMADSRGQMRPGFLGGGQPGMADPNAVAGANARLIAKGYVQNDRGGWQRGGTGGAPSAPMPGLMARPSGPTVANQKLAAARDRRLGLYNQRQQAQQTAMQSHLEMLNPQYGLAMAQLRQQGEYQQGLLGVQKEGMASQERIAGQGLASREKIAGLQGTQRMDMAKLQNEQADLQRQHEQALRSGDRESAALLAKQHAENQQKLAEMQTGSQEKIAGIAGQTQRDIAKESHGYQRDSIQLQREQLAQQRSDALRQQAQQAYQSGDIQRGQQLEQMATAGGGLMGGVGAAPVAPPAASGGLMGPSASGGRLPPQARAAVDQAIAAHQDNPQVLVQRLRGMGLTDQQINMELANAFGTGHTWGIMGGLSTGSHQRTADAPNGAWFTQVDPNTGLESPTALGLLNPRWWGGGLQQKPKRDQGR